MVTRARTLRVAVRHLSEEEGVTLEQRILDKLDDVVSGQSTLAADVARIQGTQEGMRQSIETVSRAIGDVTEVKIRTEAMSAKVDNLIRRVDGLETETRTERRDSQWQEFLRHMVSGIAGGAGVGAALHFLR
jgi:FtsZ-binding cell division protein ZapB